MIYLWETILRYIFLIFLILFGFSSKGYTDVIKFNQLVIEDPWIKESPSNHPVTGGYLTIRNLGKTEDILINVSADFAMKSEIHEMKMEGDVMKMRSLENGLIIPAGGEIHLKPGGYHLMFIRLKQKMTAMDVHKITLTFKNSGSVIIPMPVYKMKHKKKHNH